MRQVAIVLAALSCSISSVPAEAARPNVVVILTDDQGWGDLSCHGNSNLSTPEIDSLASDGAAFEYFYVCPVCAPTRAEFLTGRYYHRTGVSGVSRGEGRLNADETTIADLFQKAGYATGCFGKWHNGTQPPLHPNDRGFDEFYGFTSGHWGHYFDPPLDHNRQRVRGKGYVADDFTNHAIRFIDDNRNRPFFCYLPFNTPHSPMMVADRFYDKFDGVDPNLKHRDPDKEDVMMTRAALAMCENIDWNVGRLLQRLRDLQLADNTIVVFFCDNGPNSWRWNGGMKGRKGSVDEGGVRSPCFIRWPNRIQRGLTVPNIAGAIDLLPTLCDLAGIKCETRKPVDGLSLASLLDGKADAPSTGRAREENERSTGALRDRVLYSVKQKQGIVSVRNQRFRLDPEGQLFDIAADVGQRTDVADQFPQIATKLKRLALAHRAEVRRDFAASAGRPFHVGFGRSTTLPARDGEPHGTLKRSSKAPNNSFFTHWTSVEDSITWKIFVRDSGRFEATVWYTCAAGNEGCTVELATDGGHATSSQVTEVFDPPLYDKPFERVEKSHYFVKDFRPLKLGRLNLPAGEHTLRLTAPNLTGSAAIDVHSVDLLRLEDRSSPE